MSLVKAKYIEYKETFNFELESGTILKLKVSKANEKFSKHLLKITVPMLQRNEWYYMIEANNGWLNNLAKVKEETKEKTLDESIPKEEPVKEEVVFKSGNESLKGIKEKLRFLQSSFNVKKDSKNSFGNYKYRNCDSIYAGIKPYLDKLNLTLTLSDEVLSVGDRVYIKATATLTDVEEDKQILNSAFAREALIQKGMSESQITGTASSYARKYAMSGLFLLDDTTDSDDTILSEGKK